MSLMLSDLLVWLNPVVVDVSADRFIAKTRPATLADLVEVLKGMGAVEVKSRMVAKRYWPVIQLEGTDEPGSYLVVPLDGFDSNG